jgi:hypothetical protein
MTRTLLPVPPTPPEVLILGAGFSRNLSQHFPCTDQLGTAVAAAAGIDAALLPARGFEEGNFETWLSQLAEDQPYLSEAENFHNRARFMDVTRAIVTTLRARELKAFKGDAPSWLYKLLSVAHYRRPTVITLNYDTVIEVGLESHHLTTTDDPVGPDRFPAEGGQPGIGADDVLANFPPRIRSSLPARGVSFNGVPIPIARSFRLLKLHGSLDWFWASGDLTGETLRRTTVTNRFTEPLDDPDLRREEVEGLDPFIVPPTATKSPYYSNLRTRWLWRQAAEVLRAADRIALLGYSLPPADLVMSGMLEEAARRTSVLIEVVDRDPSVPTERLRKLGANHIEQVKGDDCMESFVGLYSKRAAFDLVEALRASTTGDASLLVECGETSFGTRLCAVEKFEHDSSSGELLLVLKDTAVPVLASGASLSALVAQLDPGVNRLVARTTDGQQLLLVAAVHGSSAGPARSMDLLTFLPVGKVSGAPI